MPGIYIHIPFCKKKCPYCDFYSVTGSSKKNRFINTLIKEIELQKKYLDNEKVNTIYFGGGTPSLLFPEEIQKITDQVTNNFQVAKNAELTLEANPDDVNEKYINELKHTQINRLSIGVQSFNDDLLYFLNRRHNSRQAIESVKLAQKAGYKNISIDLIYGIPGLSAENWEDNLERAVQLNTEHISAYHLTIEPKTILGKKLEEGKFFELHEELSWQQFNILIDRLEEAKFEHYEISNFAKNNKYSKHNTSYWQNIKYLGIGPSAHSYNHYSRQWNVANINKYIHSVEKGVVPFEKEELSINDKYNDYILTWLRTIWGIDIIKVQKEFGDFFYNHFLKVTNETEMDLITIKDKNVTLTKKGMFLSNQLFLKYML